MVDAAIIGGGPAGLAAAIFLARAGVAVILVTNDDRATDKIGESLAPESKPILQQLGVWDAFLADSHLPCPGNRSAWGSASLTDYSFIGNPYGCGWHLDRRRFENGLAQRATVLGVEIVIDRILPKLARSSEKWHLHLAASNREIVAPTIVDATGRNSWFARRQGIRRYLDDRQVAVTAFLEPEDRPLTDATSLVEAVADGWWYSARLPDDRLAVFRAADPSWDRRRWWTELAATRYTSDRARHYRQRASVKTIPANSSRLERFSGWGWLAIGDAAIGYDPLSAHGLTLALASARDGAKAILDRDFTAYDRRLQTAYDRYRQQRRHIYRLEQRWPQSSYWQQRH